MLPHKQDLSSIIVLSIFALFHGNVSILKRLLSLVGTVDRELVHTVRSVILPQACSIRVSPAGGVHRGILLLALVVICTNVVSEVESKLLRDSCAVIKVLENGGTEVIVCLLLSFASPSAPLAGRISRRWRTSRG